MARERRTSATAREPGERVEFVLELPSDLRVIGAAVGYLCDRLESFSYGGSRLNLNFRVGVTEALANAMLYGNRCEPEKPVRVEVAMDHACVSLTVVDQGSGFDPDSVPDPTLPQHLERTGGRGLFLIRELMDEVEFNRRGNSVRLVLRRDETSRRSSGTRG
jgi:serine/threonine-protein kinase RsbW